MQYTCRCFQEFARGASQGTGPDVTNYLNGVCRNMKYMAMQTDALPSGLLQSVRALSITSRLTHAVPQQQYSLTSKILLSTTRPPSSRAPKPASEVAAVGPSICTRIHSQDAVSQTGACRPNMLRQHHHTAPFNHASMPAGTPQVTCLSLQLPLPSSGAPAHIQQRPGRRSLHASVAFNQGQQHKQRHHRDVLEQQDTQRG